MGEVRRVYVEKKKDYAVKAKELHASLKQYLGCLLYTSSRFVEELRSRQEKRGVLHGK